MTSGHVLTSITKRPAWPNHDFFFIIQRNNFEVTISCFDKFCVGNSTLTFNLSQRCVVRLDVTHNQVYVTFTATLYRMTFERTDFQVTNKQKKSFLRKVAVGTHFSLFPQPFSANFWVRKVIKFGYSCFLCQILHSWYRQSSFLHSATPRARDGLSESLVQDLAKKALVPKLDSYNNFYNVQHDMLGTW